LHEHQQLGLGEQADMPREPRLEAAGGDRVSLLLHRPQPARLRPISEIVGRKPGSNPSA
jgi:hypothetical protein